VKGITFKYLKVNSWARFKLHEPWLPNTNGIFGNAWVKFEFNNVDLEKSGKLPMSQYKEPPYREEEKL
jgi:hypothetical protein